MASKLDNTHQTIENIVGARVDEINGELVLINEDAFPEPISITGLFKKYIGQAVDLKLGGATPISSSMFDE